MKNILAISCFLIITLGSYKVGKTVADTYWKLEVERARSEEIMHQQNWPVATTAVGGVVCVNPPSSWSCGNVPSNWITSSTATTGMMLQCVEP